MYKNIITQLLPRWYSIVIVLVRVAVKGIFLTARFNSQMQESDIDLVTLMLLGTVFKNMAVQLAARGPRVARWMDSCGPRASCGTLKGFLRPAGACLRYNVVPLLLQIGQPCSRANGDMVCDGSLWMRFFYVWYTQCSFGSSIITVICTLVLQIYDKKDVPLNVRNMVAFSWLLGQYKFRAKRSSIINLRNYDSWFIRKSTDNVHILYTSSTTPPPFSNPGTHTSKITHVPKSAHNWINNYSHIYILRYLRTHIIMWIPWLGCQREDMTAGTKVPYPPPPSPRTSNFPQQTKAQDSS